MARYNLAEELTSRGLVAQQTDEELFSRLATQPTSVYCGFDPTADSLHVGNLLMLCTLRRFQLASHRPIALAGGATGMVGDPGGRSEERNLLTVEQLSQNLEGINEQLGRFLDFTPGAGTAQAIQLDNASWLSPMSVLTYLRDIGKHFTVNEMVAKDSVKSRFERPDQGISYTEFSYMLLQAADFLHLYQHFGCTVQVGGSDQWGNITAGTSLIRKVTGGHAAGITMPLVTKADGTKFGKSVGGAVWLDANKTSPYQLYQFFMSAEDAMAPSYLRYFTFLDHDELQHLETLTNEQPHQRAAQRTLAKEVTTLVHGADHAQRAEQASVALFSGTVASLDAASLKAIASDVPTSSVSPEELSAGVFVIDAAIAAGLVSSKAEARRSIEQGGLSINDVRVEDLDASLTSSDVRDGGFIILRKGKRQYHLLIVE
jgi:tyrosyl-tRNA synthetase